MIKMSEKKMNETKNEETQYLSPSSSSSLECFDDEDCSKINKIFASTSFDLASTGGNHQNYDHSIKRCIRRVRSAGGTRRRNFMLFYIRVLAAVFILLLIIQFTPNVGMANTLAHIKNLHWLVIEDENHTVKAVERLLQRTELPYTYFASKTVPGYPRRGWYQRTRALQYLRNNTELITEGSNKSVVFFGDDDNSYDIRLFNNYIRNVKKVGIWAVGLAGGTLVESPKVANGTVIGWNVLWNPSRKFATDMAGFAVDLDVILKYFSKPACRKLDHQQNYSSTAEFGTSCTRGLGAPETCFLEDLGLTISDLEPYGFDEEEREILVWHTQTVKVTVNKRIADTNGFFVE